MIKHFLLLLFFTPLLFSSQSLLHTYRLEGIDKVESLLNKQLMSQKNWQDNLKSLDTTFGYFENAHTFLVCDKNASTLSLYVNLDNKKFVLENTYNAFTGKYSGDKEVEGDLKTPVGVYTLRKKLTHVDEFYGPMAFVTSYPNIYDRIRHKNGSGIWIHGLPINEQKRDSFTKGCIAINNNDILCLDPNIFINNTLLYISEKPKFTHTKEELSLLLAQLFQWRNAWLHNDLSTYLSFYDPGFIHSNKRDFEEFKNFKSQVFSYNDSKKIIFENITIVPYPSENNEHLFRIGFLEKYTSKRTRFTGNKILIVKLINNKMQILTEK